MMENQFSHTDTANVMRPGKLKIMTDLQNSSGKNPLRGGTRLGMRTNDTSYSSAAVSPNNRSTTMNSISLTAGQFSQP